MNETAHTTTYTCSYVYHQPTPKPSPPPVAALPPNAHKTAQNYESDPDHSSITSTLDPNGTQCEIPSCYYENGTFARSVGDPECW
eukprot:CAMPEP_0201577568 /NCGR_PEP_ID=MMETSP0190_2-20130828/24012_1 /ASSEMBLY_ACC=CAM_ASM_000263 /TAXON_ID=37353 /ORGANISM="Rosalina sp." /LENGTH=84 /DNA_ID=CAMNT_0048009725 /DNA_START=120 /DNA_END=371 /DNA_ORIENTATION=+